MSARITLLLLILLKILRIRTLDKLAVGSTFNNKMFRKLMLSSLPCVNFFEVSKPKEI